MGETNCIQFLINEKNFPVNLINVEKVVRINGLNKRYDIIVYNSDGSIFLIVECKAPKVKISQSAFDQIARYNLNTKSLIFNGH